MKIGIIGRGNVGATLGALWAKGDHTVCYGVRAPDASTSTERPIADAVRESDIVALAIPWSAVHSLPTDPGLFQNKIVIDCTNPIRPDFSGLSIAGNDSAGETIQRMLPEAKV